MSDLQRFLFNAFTALLNLTVVDGAATDTERVRGLVMELLRASPAAEPSLAVPRQETSPPTTSPPATFPPATPLSASSPPATSTPVRPRATILSSSLSSSSSSSRSCPTLPESRPSISVLTDPSSSLSSSSRSCLTSPESRPSISVLTDPIATQEVLTSSREYPDGEMHYRFQLLDDYPARDFRSVGWATFVYGSNKNSEHRTWFKACLGNFECPVSNCTFHERPRVPRGTKTKHSLPQPTTTYCPRHSLPLKHVACTATMKVMQFPTHIELDHSGVHHHRRPHPIRANVQSRRKFAEVVRSAPEVAPKSLQIGTFSRPPISELHSSFNNLSRLSRERSKVLRVLRPQASIGMAADFERRLGVKMIASTSIAAEDGHITMITQFQTDRLREKGSCLQSDTVEGFVVDDNCPNVNLTMTTGFIEVMDRHVPLCISILMGKSAFHYAAHFAALFKAMKMPSDFELWVEAFPGNVCDFSDAERKGFDIAIRRHCSLGPDVAIDLDVFFQCCRIHFKRTLSRVSRNAALVPPQKRKDFWEAVCALLDDMEGDNFIESVKMLKSTYPKLICWLDWHLARGQFIFPAMRTSNAPAIEQNTNAQERIGGDFQQTAPKKKLTIAECMDHGYRYTTQLALDYRLAEAGMALRYKRRSSKRSYQSNDGRPPDTNDALLPGKRRRIGRPRGSRNAAPTHPIAVESFGITWSFTFGDFSATNTCAMDTVLMTLFVLSKYAGLHEVHESAALHRVMALIEQEKHEEGRFVWWTDVLGNRSSKGQHNLFSSLFDHTTSSACEHLFNFTTTSESICGSEFCPERGAKLSLSTQSDQMSFHQVYTDKLDEGFRTELLDQFFTDPIPGPCSLSVARDHLNTHPEEQHFFNEVPINNLEDLEAPPVWEWRCAGTRSYRPRRIKKYPTILQVAYPAGSESLSYATAKPDRTVLLEGREYNLVAVIYSTRNWSHFASHIHAQNRMLFYDGMNQPVLRWDNMDAYQQTSMPIAKLWYMRPVLSSSPFEDSKSSSSDSSQSENDTAPSMKGIPPRDVREALVETPLQRKSKRRTYPVGVSLQVVADRGPCPKCISCRTAIDRGASRVVNKVCTSTANNYWRILSYHNKDECLKWMTDSQRSCLPSEFRI